MKTRAEALSNLLFYHMPIEQLVSDLKQFPWDSEIALVVLTPEHILHVGERYLKGELTEEQLEDWANAIECREDIAFLPAYKTMLEDAIYQLANPLLTSPITFQNVEHLLSEINSASV